MTSLTETQVGLPSRRQVDFAVHEGGVAVITIDRPEARNALNAAVRRELFAAWERFETDPDLRVAILTGAGDKAFCAGADLKEMAQAGVGVPPLGGLPVPGDTVQVTKPTIAAVNGVAYAAGWLLAQACDLCVACETARFAMTEVKVGRGAPWAAPLIHMLPQRVMTELLLTGDPMSARRGYELGFVNALAEPQTLLETALNLARKIACNAPLSVSASKEVVRLATEMGRSAALRAARHAFEHAYRSEDAKEGPRAFREKRDPVWQAR